ncbi:MAG: putative MFS family arabinose efflux permease, partial [Saprospiraceae bacterium]
SLGIWSLMTAVSGLATNFVQLLLARIGVGIGEAGGSPPSHSIISDYFPPEKRATALSVYSTGIYIGILFGYLAGGWIDEFFGWRTAFFVIGLPGLAYALLLLFTVKEPVKGQSDSGTEIEETSFLEVFRILFSKKTFIYVSMACGLHTFTVYGMGNFFAPFLARVHGMSIGNIGMWMGIVVGFGGIIGTFAGGYLADKYGSKNIRMYLLIPVIAGIASIPFSITQIFHGNATFVLVMHFFTALLTALYLGPSIAVTHNLVNAKMRALASAVLFFFLNLIGLGLGPLTIGYLSDVLTPTYGNESLRYAFCFTFIPSILSMFLFYMASKHYEDDIDQTVKGASDTDVF